jgi:hypothetical protein
MASSSVGSDQQIDLILRFLKDNQSNQVTEQQIPNESNGKGWGGKREGAGRPPGPDRFPLSSKKMRELAQSYTDDAFEELVSVMHTAEAPRDRLLAISLLLA